MEATNGSRNPESRWNWLRAIAAFAAMLALSISGAMAHAVLTESTPQDGSRLVSSPGEIVLRFSEPVSPVQILSHIHNTEPTIRT